MSALNVNLDLTDFDGQANLMKGLYVKQFVDENLGNSSYLIASESTAEAAVIDPQRDVEKYIQSADGLGCS